MRYLSVARRRRRRSSRDNPAQGDPAPLDKYASSDIAHDSRTLSLETKYLTLYFYTEYYKKKGNFRSHDSMKITSLHVLNHLLLSIKTI